MKNTSADIPRALVEDILYGYALPPMGIHGMPHWGRVLENGLRLAEYTGANVDVVRLFAVFHDARRVNDIIDPGHGRRGAELAFALRDRHLRVSDEEFDLLVFACTHHTDGTTEGDITVQTCWDADRLDLWRVDIPPRDRFLCTDAAKDPTIKEWARERSIAGHVPAFVRDEWASG